MSAITYEVSAKNNKLRGSLRDSSQQITNWRKQTVEQLGQVNSSIKQIREGGKGEGLFGAVFKGNLAARAAEKGVEMLKQGADAIGELVDASDQLGIPAATLDKMGRVMEGAGVKTENLRKALFSLNTVRQAAINGDEAAAAKLAELGITVADLQQSKLEDTFYAVADGLAAIDDNGERAQRAVDLLGTRQSKLIGGMAAGGAEMKKQMTEVAGAVSDANARAVDDTMDSLQSAGSALKGWFVNLAGGTVRSVTKLKDDFKAGIADHAKELAMTDPKMAEAEEKRRQQKEAEADAAAERAKAQAAKRQAAMEINASLRKNIETGEARVAAAHEEAEAEREVVTVMKESLTATQRYQAAVMALIRARQEYDAAEDGSVMKEQKRAALAKARAGFEEQRAVMVHRLGLPMAEQQAEAHAERQAQKAAERGERVFREKGRDAIDREFRKGKITKEERDKQLDDLRVKPAGGPENIPAEMKKTLEDIKNYLTRNGGKVGLV